MSEQYITYFGYGSLVNRDTRPAGEQAMPARLYGWRRVWGHRVTGSTGAATGARQSCCSLSIEPVGHSAAGRSSNAESSAIERETNNDVKNMGDEMAHDFIDGVLVNIPLSDLPALDQRENGYDRIKLSAKAFDLPEKCTAEHVHVYVSDESHAGFSNEQFPILQSYIDCVIAGYCAVFEQSGMQHFLDSTNGWDGVVENDRAEPKYPRAVALPPSQLATIDDVVSSRRLRGDA